MIDLKYIVKTSLIMPLLKRIISIFLIILTIAGLILLDRFLKTQFYHLVGVFSVSYWFFYFVTKLIIFWFFYFVTKLIIKILDFYDNWR